jgi:hypothetical protein
MKYFIGFFTWLFIASGWPIVTQQLGAAQVNRPRPADIRIDHDVLAENQRLEYIFLDVLQGTGLHGGFVEVAVCSDLPKGHLQIKQGLTVRQAMDALVAANPGYRWELRNGVVDLMPRGGVPLLSTRIAKYKMNVTDREIAAVLHGTLKLAEVRERSAAIGLKPGVNHGPGGEAVESHPVPRKHASVQINLQNVSLQEAFNKIVQASPDAVWIYHENDCNGAKTFTVQMASHH